MFRRFLTRIFDGVDLRSSATSSGVVGRTLETLRINGRNGSG